MEKSERRWGCHLDGCFVPKRLPPSVKRLIIAESSSETPEEFYRLERRLFRFAFSYFFQLLDFITINNHCALIRSRWLQIMEGIESSCLSIHYTTGILPFYPFQYSQERATVWFGFWTFCFFGAVCLSPSASGRNPSSGLEGRVEACICESTGGMRAKVQTGTLWKKNRARLLGLERNALPEAASPLLHPSQFQFHRFIRVYPFTRTRPADVLATGKLLPPCLVAY